MEKFDYLGYLQHAKILDETKMSERDWLERLRKLLLHGTALPMGGAYIHYSVVSDYMLTESVGTIKCILVPLSNYIG